MFSLSVLAGWRVSMFQQRLFSAESSNLVSHQQAATVATGRK
jgi:hypothetical protein